MATVNPFDLLDNDSEDPALVLAKAAAAVPVSAPAQPKKGAQPPAKTAAKPSPPSQAVREPRNEGQRGGRGGAGRGGRGGRGYNRDAPDNGFPGGYSRPSEDGEKAPAERRSYGGPRGGGGFRGARRGGFSNGESEEGGRPRRTYDRHSGSGRGNEFKREGAGRGNWGTPTDEIVAPETEEPINEVEKIVDADKPAAQDDAADTTKEAPANEEEEKEPEDKEMTLEEYEKVLEEKRKALLALKTEERKVVVDKELKSMQPLANKKLNEDVFAKLGVDKDKKKEAAERVKKSVSINEFLKPAEGDNYRSGGRGRGRGRGRGGFNGGGNNNYTNVQAPKIGDDVQFPTLGGK